jgi:hypothetical protein
MDWSSFVLGFLVNFAFLGILAVVTAARNLNLSKTQNQKAE